MKNALILFSIALFTIHLNAQLDSVSLKKLQSEQVDLENKISQIRQNQLNYKIEKDLLKETYTTNYERIQSIITLILGVFTVLGFLGIRSIWNLKKNYETELNEIRTLKAMFENDHEILIDKLDKLDLKIKAIDSINEKQDIALKILDLRERIESLIKSRQYIKALEYITVGLEINPERIGFKQSKAFVLFRLQKYREAIKLHQEILKIEPKNDDSLFDLAELLLIVKDDQEFEQLRNTYKDELDLNPENPKTVFFDAFYNFNKQNVDLLNSNISIILDGMDTDEVKKHFVWDFSDLKLSIKDRESNSLKRKIIGLTNLLDGSWTKKKYLESIRDV
ncbi:tetratricopeptide repeat protein [Spongiimicrobium salis]|uniref:tetratricopeptide repeat protein n=1 Tax=Spongiimicrobium salis TaxID=1667022 RepID=UPI00374DD49D